MAQTEILRGDVKAVQRWSRMLVQEFIGETFFKRFMGKSDGSIIQVHQDLSSGPGDTIKYDLLVKIPGYGVKGAARLKGQEKAMTYHQDSLGIEQLREGVNWDTMSQQRTVHDFLMDSTRNLGLFFARVHDELMFAHLVGNVGDNATLSTELGTFGGNTIVAQDAAHRIDNSGTPMSIDFIRQCKEKAYLLEPMVRPVRVDGEDKYVLVMRPEQVTSLKNESGTAKWREITALARERGSKNPVYTGALGEFDNVVLHESRHLPRTNSTNLNYATFLGAQAGHVAFGQRYEKIGSRPKETKELFSMFDDVDDYGDKIGIAGATIFGVKRAIFNSATYGCINLETTDAQAS